MQRTAAFDLVRDFGILTSGESTPAAHAHNSAAFIAANLAGRKALAQGASRVLWTMPPNVRGYHDVHASSHMFHGLTALTVDWNGAHFSDLVSGEKYSTYPAACSPTLYELPEARVASAPAGQSHLDCLDPAEGAHFPAGGWLLIGCLAVQKGNYPPNYQFFEFCRVASVAGGRITLAEPLTEEYRADYPDYGNPSETNWRRRPQLYGAARIHLLDHVTRDGKPIPWAVDQHYMNGRFDLAQAFAGTTSYLTGRKLRYTNMAIAGFTPGFADEVTIERCPPETHQNEPDKCVNRIIVRDSHLRSWGFQSASIKRAEIHDSEIDALGVGAPRSFVMVGGHVKAVGVQVNQGVGGDSRFAGTDIGAVPYGLNQLAGNFPHFTVDGTDVRYAHGAFRARLNIGSVACVQLMRPKGARIMLLSGARGAASLTPDYAVGTVTRCRQDGNEVVMQTTLPYATLPAWASGEVFAMTHNTPVLVDCTGAAEVIQASQAARRRMVAGAYRHVRLSGRCAQVVSRASELAGRLSRVEVDIVKSAGASLRTGARLTVFQYTVNAVSGARQSQLAVSIDVGAAGRRAVDRHGWSGRSPNDAVTRGGGLDALPNDSFGLGFGFAFTYDPASTAHPASDLPIVELAAAMEPAAIERRNDLWR